MVSMATTVPSIVVVFLLGRFYGGVQMPAWQWIVCALAIWFGALIFAALAVAIGYRLIRIRCSRSPSSSSSSSRSSAACGSR